MRFIDTATGIISTVAGNGDFMAEGPHDSVDMVTFVFNVSVDPSGGVYFAEPFAARVRRYHQGTMALVVGLGDDYRPGQTRRADTQVFQEIDAIAVDDNDNVYVLHNDAIAHIAVSNIVKIDPAGTMTYVAGHRDQAGYEGEGGPALDAKFRDPERIEFIPSGRLLVSDTRNYRVRSIDLMTGRVDLLIGNGNQSPTVRSDGALATSVPMMGPLGLGWFDGVVVGDPSIVRRLDPADETLSTIAGTTAIGGSFTSGQPALDAAMRTPLALVADRQAGLLILGEVSHDIRRLDAAGNLTRIAGRGVAGFGGDGGPATSARFSAPSDIAIDSRGNIFVADTGNNRVRRIDAATSIVTTFAGTGSSSTAGDGALAANAHLGPPIGVAVAPDDDLLIATEKSVRRVDAGTSIITTIAGPVFPPGDGVLAESALTGPVALATLEPGKRWLVADRGSGSVRLVDRDARELRTVAGYGGGHAIDGGQALYADLLKSPSGIAYDPTTQQAYICERSAHVITRLDLSVDPPAIYHFAGVRGRAGYDAARPSLARLSSPTGLSFADGALYVADTGNHVIRRIDLSDPSAPIQTVAGRPERRGFHGDGGPATSALLNAPEAVLVRPGGALYISDTSNHRVRRVDATSVIETVVGDGTASVSGAGRPATEFAIASPRGLALDRFGNLFVASPTTVRVVTADGSQTAGPESAVYNIDVATRGSSAPPTLCITDLVVYGPDDDQIAVLDRCQGSLTEVVRR